MDNNYFNNQPNQDNTPDGNDRSDDNRFQPQNPYAGSATYTTPKTDTFGSSSQIMGILSIVLAFVCCSVIGIVLGAMAISRSKRSVAEMGYESSEAKTGNICGIIGLVIGIIGTLITLVFIALYAIGVMAIISEGGTIN